MNLKTDPKLLKPLLGWSLALGLLSNHVAKGRCHGLDQLIAEWVAALRSPALDGPVQWVTFVGDPRLAPVALAVLSVWVWRSKGWTVVGMLLGAFALSLALEWCLRITVAHWRPDTLNVPASMSLSMKFHLAGFPSGHGIRSAFLVGWIMRSLKDFQGYGARVVRGACLGLIFLVGFTRVYLNRHWAADILGSWLVVLVVFSIAACWERAWRQARQVEA